MKEILSEIGRLNHIAIAVPDIQKASSIWKNALGANISSTKSLPEHGVKVVFIESPNTKVELLEWLQLGTFAATAPSFDGSTDPWVSWNPQDGSMDDNNDIEL